MIAMCVCVRRTGHRKHCPTSRRLGLPSRPPGLPSRPRTTSSLRRAVRRRAEERDGQRHDETRRSAHACRAPVPARAADRVRAGPCEAGSVPRRGSDRAGQVRRAREQ